MEDVLFCQPQVNLYLATQTIAITTTILFKYLFLFSIWISFTNIGNSQDSREEAICLTSLYHFYPLHRHLDISQTITAESSPLHIASSRTQTGKPSASYQPLSYAPYHKHQYSLNSNNNDFSN